MNVKELCRPVARRSLEEEAELREVPESIWASLAEAWKKVISVAKGGGVKSVAINHDRREDSSLATCSGPLITCEIPFMPIRRVVWFSPCSHASDGASARRVEHKARDKAQQKQDASPCPRVRFCSDKNSVLQSTRLREKHSGRKLTGGVIARGFSWENIRGGGDK